MEKLIFKIFAGVLIFFSFLTLTQVYLMKSNRAIEPTTKLQMLPEKISLRSVGEEFFVHILLNSQENEIAAVDTVIKFDKDVLEVVDVVPLGVFATYPDASRVIDNRNGLVFLSGVNYDMENKTFTDPFQSIGLFGRITFRVKKSIPTILTFVYGEGAQDETNIIEDQTGQDIIFNRSQLIEASIN